VTIQYCLLAGVNDSLAQAHLLAQLISPRRMHVNVLRYHPTGLGLRGSSMSRRRTKGPPRLWKCCGPTASSRISAVRVARTLTPRAASCTG